MYWENIHTYWSYFGLQASAQRGAGVINHYHDVTLHGYIQRNLRSPVLHLKIPAETAKLVRDGDAGYMIIIMSISTGSCDEFHHSVEVTYFILSYSSEVVAMRSSPT